MGNARSASGISGGVSKNSRCIAYQVAIIHAPHRLCYSYVIEAWNYSADGSVIAV